MGIITIRMGITIIMNLQVNKRSEKELRKTWLES